MTRRPQSPRERGGWLRYSARETVKDRAERLISLSRQLTADLAPLTFSSPVTHVYNPLEYARAGWEAYLRLAVTGTRRVILLGMNPGPWGMAQTGVPFGEIPAVRRWMGMEATIGVPENPHPKRPIQGFDCPRSEVSGRRLWGLMRDRFGTADRFFSGHFVANYCPLVFMAESGRNITPDKLAPAERGQLFTLCDTHLVQTIQTIEPDYVIGVGKFALSRIRTSLGAAAGELSSQVTAGSVLHPSPASPAANKGWAAVATRQLVELGVWTD